MQIYSDFKDILRAFNEFNVEYLIIGGYAVTFHAEPRYTKDLDLWVRANRENSKVLFQALQAFGAPLVNLNEDSFAEEGFFYQIGVIPVRVDIVLSVSGVQFQEAWEKRVEADLDDVKVYFMSKEDLILSKLAAGRPQDIIDAQLLALSKNQSKQK